ncbi:MULTISPECIES: hypothetical protein [unclassified Streptomyces]|uniref:hypothetical protein n=1 Tax=unclassified Streptomyces TaxID=2593676 RepID=UPI0006892000|nr:MULTISPECIES: hypothetical protein [unclassified Streptomyces]
MSSSRTTSAEAGTEPADSTVRTGRPRPARTPWAVVGAVATVLFGPAGATASALDRANAAPMHHGGKTDRTGGDPATHRVTP